jgi:hypothetical protein
VASARVDSDDLEDLRKYQWSTTKEGYARSIHTNILMHRYVMKFPTKLVVDHIGWNRLDNRKKFLRVCTRADNARNGTNGWNFGKRLLISNPKFIRG